MKNLLLFVIMVLVLLIGSMASIDALSSAKTAKTKFKIVQVTDNSYNEHWPIISFSESGQGLMVWSVHHSWQENQYMYYSLWDGEPASWSSGIPFDTTGWRHHRMSIDYKPGTETDEAMLVFVGSRDFLTFDEICYVKWDGESWGSESYLADEVDDDDYQGTFKWSPDGSYGLNIWVDDNVWNDEYDKRAIAYSKWDGSNWGTSATITTDEPENFTRHGDGGLDFDSSSEKAIVTYYRNDGYGSEIYYQVWDGSSWGDEEFQLTTDTENFFDDTLPWVKFDDEGNGIIIWQRHDGNDWEIYYSLWDGSAFTGDSAMTDNMYDDRNPTAVYDSRGLLHIFWYGTIKDKGKGKKGLGTDTEILYTKFDGKGYKGKGDKGKGYKSFSKTIQITDNTRRDVNQLPSIDNDGNIHLVWLQHDGNDYEVMRTIIAPPLAKVNIAPGTFQVIDEGKGKMKKIAVINSPDSYGLFKNYPNPFNPETEIRYQLPNPSQVSLIIYNLMGQQIKTLINSYHSAGFYSVKWDGTNNQGMKVASGIYIYIMRAGSFVDVKKLVFIQ